MDLGCEQGGLTLPCTCPATAKLFHQWGLFCLSHLRPGDGKRSKDGQAAASHGFPWRSNRYRRTK